jgi:hypothetical protein
LVSSEQPAPAPDGARRRPRKPEDTAAGCRAFAAADLARAAASAQERMRGQMEHSAAAWTARADMLERLDRTSRRRSLQAASPGRPAE